MLIEVETPGQSPEVGGIDFSGTHINKMFLNPDAIASVEMSVQHSGFVFVRMLNGSTYPVRAKLREVREWGKPPMLRYNSAAGEAAARIGKPAVQSSLENVVSDSLASGLEPQQL